jgi:PEGA domain
MQPMGSPSMRAARTLRPHCLLLFLLSLATPCFVFADAPAGPEAAPIPGAVLNPAAAPSPDVNTQVDVLYERAKAEIDAARLPVAVETLREALSLRAPDPKRTWKVLMALAVAYDEMKRPLLAAEYIQLFLNALDAYDGEPGEEWSGRRAMMEEWVVELRAVLLRTHSVINLLSTPGGAHIRVDSRAYGDEGLARTPFMVFLAPGEHRVQLDLDDCDAFETRVTTAIGSAELMDATLACVLPEPPPEPPPEPQSPVEAPAPLSDVSLKTHSIFDAVWGWAAIGGGVAIAAAGIPFTVMANGDYDEQAKLQYGPDNDDTKARYDDLASSMSRNQVVAGLLYGTGIAAVVGGAVYVWLAADEGATDTEPPLLGLRPFGDGAVMTYGWRW